MSSLTAKIAKAASRSPSPRPGADRSGGSSSTSATQQEQDKYRLLVTAGPNYDPSTHKIVHVNTDTATPIDNEFIRAKLKVRIKGFRGLPSSCPSTSPYFSDSAHERDQYSVAFSFVPKQDLPSLDVIWGNDFDHPVRDRLPPGFNTAFRIVKEFIDPGLECDAYADEPWLYGPALSCWFGLRIGDKIGQEAEIPEAAEAKDIVREGADGSGRQIRTDHGLPENNEKRRKFFLSAQHREPFIFEKDRLYQVDFYNPYLDFGNFALKLPGFSIKVIKYIDEKSHVLRYVFKNRKTGDVYFCVNFNLLWGEQLQKALRDDQGQLEKLAGAEINGNDDEKDGRNEEVADEDQWHDAVDGSSKEDEPLPPGMVDKPDVLREQIKRMDITETLQDTASDDKRSGRARVLEDLD